MSTPRSLVLSAAAGSVAAAALVLSACGSAAAPAATGSSHPASTASAHPSTTSPSSRAGATSHTVRACGPSALKISLDTSSAGAAAGSSYVPLVFRNVSPSACTLPAFPQVSFAAGSAGPDIGTPAIQQDVTRAQVMTLAPGKFAHAWLQIVEAANYPPGKCKPVTAHGLRIRLAAAESTSFVARDIPACAQLPQGSSILAVFPVQAGRASRGTAP